MARYPPKHKHKQQTFSAKRNRTSDRNCAWTYFTAGPRGYSKKKSHRASEKKVRARTGYGSKDLDEVWQQLEPELKEFRKKKGHDDLKGLFFCIFMYIHLGLTMSNIDVLSTPSTGCISESRWRMRLKPIMLKMAEKIDCIRWKDRLRKDNHVFHFPRVSGCRL